MLSSSGTYSSKIVKGLVGKGWLGGSNGIYSCPECSCSNLCVFLSGMLI